MLDWAEMDQSADRPGDPWDYISRSMDAIQSPIVFIAFLQLDVNRRFKHLFKPGNEHLLESTQAFVDKKWEKLLKLEESTAL